ncbi:MAG: protein kinase, partial [Myxococcota bacterium]
MTSANFPERIGPYVPERLIGRGAMAAVYLSRGTDGRPVALKWLDQPIPAWMRRFEAEIRAIEKIKHPGVVKLLDHGDWEARPYLVMEYID